MRLTIIALALACFMALALSTTTALADEKVTDDAVKVDKNDDTAAPSVVDQLRADYAALKQAFSAYKDKNDGRKNSGDFAWVIVALLGTAFTISKTVARYIQKE